jgi:hypothetical protein
MEEFLQFAGAANLVAAMRQKLTQILEKDAPRVQSARRMEPSRYSQSRSHSSEVRSNAAAAMPEGTVEDGVVGGAARELPEKFWDCSAGRVTESESRETAGREFWLQSFDTECATVRGCRGIFPPENRSAEGARQGQKALYEWGLWGKMIGIAGFEPTTS